MTSPSLSAKDRHLPSQQPPGGLAPEETPMFVMLGFDDNPEIEPIEWMLKVLGDRGVRASFYSNGKYLMDDPALQAVHQRMAADGHDVGNHTQNHEWGGAFTEQEWTAELSMCSLALMGASVKADRIRGFRAPFLDYNAATYAVLEAMGFLYDTSLEEGFQADQDGTNYYWPYTLDEGSPGNAMSAAAGNKERVGSHPGLWSIPIHAFVVPDDELAPQYGMKPGLKDRIFDFIKENGDWEWPKAAGKISGLDWNVLEMAGMSPQEFLGVMKYNLDLRLSGNRAPMMIGLHTAMYPATDRGRREALELFIDYALSIPGVRIVTPPDLINWMRDPAPLN